LLHAPGRATDTISGSVGSAFRRKPIKTPACIDSDSIRRDPDFSDASSSILTFGKDPLFLNSTVDPESAGARISQALLTLYTINFFDSSNGEMQ
jgi:hypothetical protein